MNVLRHIANNAAIEQDTRNSDLEKRSVTLSCAAHRHLVEVQHVLRLRNDCLDDVCGSRLAAEIPRERTVRQHHIDRLRTYEFELQFPAKIQVESSESSVPGP